MRVAILAPHYYKTETGNAVTVRRLERHLRLIGCEVQVFPVDQMTAEKLLVGIKSFAPQLLHAFHGYHGGRVAHALSPSLGIPYIVTLTGTDVYQALCDQRSHDTHLALRGASRIVAFHSSIKHCLSEHLPTLTERTVIIPQGVELPGLSSCVQKTGDGEFIFLLPAGIRPVKNVLFALQPLAALHDAYPQTRLVLVGPVLDTAYGAEVMETLEQFDFARYHGAVSHQAMAGLYCQADVVLNTSHSEGMPNALLEAMSYGRPILASCIEGNRSVVKEGVTGLLFRDEEEFSAKAELLISDPHLREKLGKNGRERAQEKHSPEKEAGCYLDLYREVAAAA